jgi:hypothetical protein
MLDRDEVPVLDELLSIPLNEFQNESDQARSLPKARSAEGFALNQLNLIREEYRLPRSELCGHRAFCTRPSGTVDPSAHSPRTGF